MISVEYVAGLFDGEGCINICTSNPSKGQTRTRLRASIGNTHREVLLLIQSVFGGSIRVLKGHHKPVYVLHWDGGNAISFLSSVAPYLIIKSDQASLAAEYWKHTHDPGRMAKRIDRRGRLQTAKSQQCLEMEQAFKERMHALKGTSSTRGRVVWNGNN